MFQKLGCRQHDVCHLRCLCQEMLMDDGEEVLAREPLLYQVLLRCHGNRLVF